LADENRDIADILFLDDAAGLKVRQVIFVRPVYALPVDALKSRLSFGVTNGRFCNPAVMPNLAIEDI